jgi:hypothetical protein
VQFASSVPASKWVTVNSEEAMKFRVRQTFNVYRILKKRPKGMNDKSLIDTLISKYYIFLEMLIYRVNRVKRKENILDFGNNDKSELSNKFKLTYFSDDYNIERLEQFNKLAKSIEMQEELIAITMKFTDINKNVMTILRYHRDFSVDREIDELIIEKDKEQRDFRVVNEMVSSSWKSFLCKTNIDSKRWNACLFEEYNNYEPIKCLFEI